MIPIYLEECKSMIKTMRFLLVLVLLSIIGYTIYLSGFFQVAYLLYFKPQVSIPFPLSLNYILFFLLLPLISAILGGELMHREKENGQLRLLATKTTRKNIILGKFLALFSVLALLCLLCSIFAFLFSLIHLSLWDPISALLFFILLLFLSAMWSAITLFFSLTTSNALLWTILFSILLSLPYPLSLNGKLIPSLSFPSYLIFAGIISGYFLIFFVATLFIFNKKDL